MTAFDWIHLHPYLSTFWMFFICAAIGSIGSK